MTIDDILASSIAKEKQEEYNELSKEEQISYIFNTMLDAISNQKEAIDKIVYLLEDLNIQTATMRRRIAELEVEVDKLEDTL